MAENPDIKTKTSRASSYYGNAWTILGGIIELISIAAEISGQASVMTQVVKAHEHAGLFALLIVARPLAVRFLRASRDGFYYCMVTDLRWLRMEAVFDLGTNSEYKKEVIADNLEGYINSQYNKDLKDLGDTPTQDPYEQMSSRSFWGYDDFDSLFESLPLFVYAWGSLQGGGDRSNLSSLVLMQQAANSVQGTFWRIMYSGSNMTSLLKNTLALYEVLDLKPAMADGTVTYPEDHFKERKGATIEFKSVDFRYPMTDKLVLKDMSFSINSGQLCVIVGENGCGKSTTINMITRMYDCTSGVVLIDGRPIGDYMLSSLRGATSVMYQDYHHLPLTIRENILLGKPDSENPTEEIEEAAKLGGAYDFVQKLPLKFDTNLKPSNTGYSNASYGEDEDEETIYQKFIDSQKETKLSGGEWQRLALSKTFMKNSNKVRLLCYDEPSASLDPKAEYGKSILLYELGPTE
ncbi:ABC transporter [Ceratobasidium sp. AG-Ba]|nr:ABC transporter [Ceratobasidium sp. AG-Ba]QRW03958.1 ABC transporter [Ceratobasidium sp. AG-Ba]